MDNRREFLRKTGAVILGAGLTGVTLSQTTAQARLLAVPKPKYLWHKATNLLPHKAEVKQYGPYYREIQWPREFQLVVAFQTEKNAVTEVAYCGFNVSDYRVDYLNYDPLPTSIMENACQLLAACGPCCVEEPSFQTSIDDYWNPVTGEALVESVERQLRVSHIIYHGEQKNGQP